MHWVVLVAITFNTNSRTLRKQIRWQHLTVVKIVVQSLLDVKVTLKQCFIHALDEVSPGGESTDYSPSKNLFIQKASMSLCIWWLAYILKWHKRGDSETHAVRVCNICSNAFTWSLENVACDWFWRDSNLKWKVLIVNVSMIHETLSSMHVVKFVISLSTCAFLPDPVTISYCFIQNNFTRSNMPRTSSRSRLLLRTRSRSSRQVCSPNHASSSGIRMADPPNIRVSSSTLTVSMRSPSIAYINAKRLLSVNNLL